MSNVPSILKKLEELIDLALKATTPFEEAAVYAAADTLRLKLEPVIARRAGETYLDEKASIVFSSIARLTGFEAPGSSRALDATQGLSALSTLKLNLLSAAEHQPSRTKP